ncbi:MAG: DUF4410 domain-containing protein [Candidatus Ratteibacteria bacterium]|jgi:uncharacterized lipoprotein YmbA
MEKIGKAIWLGLILGVASILAGCAATSTVSKINVPAPEKIEASQISPLVLEVLDKTPGQKNQKLAQILEEDLKTELYNNGIQTEKEAEKTLKVFLNKISMVGFGKRFVLGLFAGQSTIETSAVLTDKNGATLAEFQVSCKGGLGGTIFQVDSPERITKKLAQDIVNRLISLKNNEQKKGGE